METFNSLALPAATAAVALLLSQLLRRVDVLITAVESSNRLLDSLDKRSTAVGIWLGDDLAEKLDQICGSRSGPVVAAEHADGWRTP